MTLQRDGAVGRIHRQGGVVTEDAIIEHLCAMGTQLAIPVDEEQRAATRARLVAMAAVRTPVAVRRPEAHRSPLRRLLAGGDAPGRRSRLTAGLAGAALTVTALGGLLAASQGAGPGDLLYDVKRGGEDTRLALAGDSTRGRTLLDFASNRLTELTELTRAGAAALPAPAAAPAGGTTVSAAGPDTALVVGTLATMDDQTTEGTWWLTSRAVRAVDPAALATLTGWAADQRTGLDTLSSSAPIGTEQAVTASTDLVAAVAARGAALQAALGCVGGPATSGADDLGPLPTPCPSLPSAPGTATAEGVGSSAGGGPSGSPNTAGMALPPTAGVLAGTGSAATGRSAVSSAVTGSATSPTPPVSSPGVPGSNGGFPLPPTPLPPTPLPPTPLPPTPLPTTGGTTTTAPPVIQLPLPVAPSSSPVCLGRLICLGP